MDSYSAVVVDVLLVNTAPFLNYQLPDTVLWLESQAPITQHQMTTWEKKKLTVINMAYNIQLKKGLTWTNIKPETTYKVPRSVLLLSLWIEHTTSLFSENCPCSERPSGAVHFTSNLERIPLSFRLVEFTSLAKLKSVILILRSSLTLKQKHLD